MPIFSTVVFMLGNFFQTEFCNIKFVETIFNFPVENKKVL